MTCFLPTRGVITIALFASAVGLSRADCVVGAKMMTSYKLLNANTILLTDGSQSIIIKTFQFMYAPASVTVLKDSFCDYSQNVLLFGDQVINANEVKDIQ